MTQIIDTMRVASPPPARSQLMLWRHPSFVVMFPEPRPNWWWRWWQWALLGWTWEKL